jgi:hypothetical protein
MYPGDQKWGNSLLHHPSNLNIILDHERSQEKQLPPAIYVARAETTYWGLASSRFGLSFENNSLSAAGLPAICLHRPLLQHQEAVVPVTLYSHDPALHEEQEVADRSGMGRFYFWLLSL